MYRFGVCHELRPSELKKHKRLRARMSDYRACQQMARDRQTKAYLMRTVLGFGLEEIGEMFGVSASMAGALVRNGKKWKE